MITPELRARIRRLFYAEHWKIGTIAAELGVHRDTVALAVEPERFTNIAFRPTAALLDPYKYFVRATLEQHPRLRATHHLDGLAEDKRRARDHRGRNRLMAACPSAQAFLENVVLHGGHLGGATGRL